MFHRGESAEHAPPSASAYAVRRSETESVYLLFCSLENRSQPVFFVRTRAMLLYVHIKPKVPPVTVRSPRSAPRAGKSWPRCPTPFSASPDREHGPPTRPLGKTRLAASDSAPRPTAGARRGSKRALFGGAIRGRQPPATLDPHPRAPGPLGRPSRTRAPQPRARSATTRTAASPRRAPSDS